MREVNWNRAKRIALLKAARRAREFFQDTHDKGGFTNRLFKKWKRKVNGRPSHLRKTGRLERGTRIGHIGANKASIVNDVPYAKLHNRGGMFTTKLGRQAYMPKRQFMGESEKLKNELKRIIEKELKHGIEQDLFGHTAKITSNRRV